MLVRPFCRPEIRRAAARPYSRHLVAGQEPEYFEILSLQFSHLGKQLGSYTEVDGFRVEIVQRSLIVDFAARAD